MAVRLAGVLCFAFLACGIVQAQAPLWTPPAPLNSYAAYDGGSDEADPIVATDGDGNWVTVWESQNGVFTAHSSNMGASWTDTYVLDDNSRGIDQQSAHVVYSGNDTWVALWSGVERNDDSSPTTGTLIVSTSIDGRAWSTPTVINPPGVSLWSVYDVDSDSSGTIVATNAIQVVRSADYGQTWTVSDTNIFPPETSFGAIRGAKIAHAGNGKWVHAVTSLTNPSDNNTKTLKVWHSTDNAATWTAPETVSTVATVLGLDARDNTIVMATAEQPVSSSQVFVHFMTSLNGGDTWSKAMQNEPLGGLEGQVFRLDADDDGNWLFLGDRNTNFPTNWDHNIIAMHSTNPAGQWTAFEPIVREGIADEINASVASDGDGGYVIVFQSADESASPLGMDYDIKAAHSMDAGATWTDPVFVNSDPLSDLPRIDDTLVRIKTGDNGTVLAVWQYDGNAYGQSQVMWARSDDNGQTWSNTAPILPDVQVVYYPQVYYRGSGKWFVWWSNQNSTAQFSMSADNGFTWMAPDIFFGYDAADSGSHGTMVKAHRAGGSPEQFGLARLEQAAQYWDEPTIIPEKPNGIAYSSGQQWFSLVYHESVTGSETPAGVYTSSDDGRTWVKHASINQPGPGAQLVSDYSGTVVAVWSVKDPGAMEFGSRVFVSKTSDNGLSWTAPLELDATEFSAGNARGAYAGSGQWIVVWDAPEDEQDRGSWRTVAAVSRNNAVTWSAPAPVAIEGYVPADTGHAYPDVAAHDGEVVVAWQTIDGLPYGDTDDIDLYYSYGLLNPPPTAARDWQLFE